jgi:hypothetical protein
MMGGVSRETCWASYKYGIKKFWYIFTSCWIFLYELYYDARIHEHKVYELQCKVQCLLTVDRLARMVLPHSVIQSQQAAVFELVEVLLEPESEFVYWANKFDPWLFFLSFSLPLSLPPPPPPPTPCFSGILFIDPSSVLSIVIRYIQYLLDLCDSLKVSRLWEVV